jgi:hypothetical protein
MDEVSPLQPAQRPGAGAPGVDVGVQGVVEHVAHHEAREHPERRPGAERQPEERQHHHGRGHAGGRGDHQSGRVPGIVVVDAVEQELQAARARPHHRQVEQQAV